MTKMSMTRKIKKGIIEKPIKKRNLDKFELKEFIALTTLVNGEMWKAMQIAGNTALITNGIELAKQAEDTAKVLLNAKNNWTSQKLRECGREAGVPCSINSETGEIKEGVKEPEVKVKKGK